MKLIAFAALFFCVAVSSFAKDRPKVTKQPLTADELAVYRFVVARGQYGNSRVADTTFLLDTASLADCIKGIKLDPAPAEPTVHELNEAVARQLSLRLVDAKRHREKIEKESDPSTLIAKGTPVDEAVKAGFANGLFSLSEIRFDRTGNYAVVGFSFVCGGLCGHGGTIVLKRTSEGKWEEYSRCSMWIA